MTPSIIFRALAATAVLAAGARPARAQSAPATQASAVVAPAAWPAHPTGRYVLEVQLPDKIVNATITIADSAGVPAAGIQTDDDPGVHEMKVTIKGTELHLNADAPKGPIELVLLRRGDAIDGRWTFAGDAGTLKGRAEK